MILFIDNDLGFIILSYAEIVSPPEAIPTHRFGGMSMTRADVERENRLVSKIMKEDEEMVILASQIIMRYGTFGLS